SRDDTVGGGGSGGRLPIADCRLPKSIPTPRTSPILPPSHAQGRMRSERSAWDSRGGGVRYRRRLGVHGIGSGCVLLRRGTADRPVPQPPRQKARRPEAHAPLLFPEVYCASGPVLPCGGTNGRSKPIGTRPRRRFGASAACNEGEGLGAAHLVEIGSDRRRVDVSLNEGLAYAARENEGQRTAHDLLVLRYGVHEDLRPGPVAGYVGKPCRQSGSLQVCGDAARVLARRKPELGGAPMCEHHADGDA